MGLPDAAIVSLRRQCQARPSLASSFEGAMNGCCSFLSPMLFSGTLVFRLPLVLLKSSLYLLQGACYPLPKEFCPSRPSVGICGALSS